MNVKPRITLSVFPGLMLLFLALGSFPTRAFPEEVPSAVHPPRLTTRASETVSIGTPVTIAGVSFSAITDSKTLEFSADTPFTGKIQGVYRSTVPRQLLIQNGGKTRIESLPGDLSGTLASLFQLIKRDQWEFVFSPEFRDLILPGNIQEAVRQELPTLVHFFLLGFWLQMTCWIWLFGHLVGRAAECLTRNPGKSLFSGLLFGFLAVLATACLIRSVVGVGLILLSIVPALLLFNLGIGVIAAAMLNLLGIKAFKPLFRLPLYFVAAPIVFFPLLIPRVGVFLFSALVLVGFGSIILSGISGQDEK